MHARTGRHVCTRARPCAPAGRPRRKRAQVLGVNELKHLLLRWRTFFYVLSFVIWFGVLTFIMRTNKPVRHAPVP